MPKNSKGRRIHVKLTAAQQEKMRRAREEIASERDDIMAEGRQLKRQLERTKAALRTVFETLRAERQAQGLSLTDMEERTGMSREFISRLENLVKANPTISTIERYAEALGRRVVLRLERL